MVQGYCMKCKAKREMLNPKKVIKGGRHFMMGTCSKCGTKMAKIVSSK